MACQRNGESEPARLDFGALRSTLNNNLDITDSLNLPVTSYSPAIIRQNASGG